MTRKILDPKREILRSYGVIHGQADFWNFWTSKNKFWIILEMFTVINVKILD